MRHTAKNDQLFHCSLRTTAALALCVNTLLGNSCFLFATLPDTDVMLRLMRCV